MENINGYYAKLKTGITLYQFEWSSSNTLFLILDDKSKKQVDFNLYDIININVITADSN
ncbi:MAG: hypothetical protein AABY22_30590 [Nanoarchaeota archaeon]